MLPTLTTNFKQPCAICMRFAKLPWIQLTVNINYLRFQLQEVPYQIEVKLPGRETRSQIPLNQHLFLKCNEVYAF